MTLPSDDPARKRRPAGALRALLPPRLRPQRSLAVGVVGLQMLQSLALLYLPTLNAKIIDDGVVRGDVGYILRFGSTMIAITVVQVVSLILAVRYAARIATAVGHDLRAALFDKVLSFSAREVARFGVPSLVTRTTNDVQQIQSLVLAAFTMFVSAPVMAVGAFLLALAQDVPLSLVLLGVIPVLGILMAWIIRRVTPLFRRMQTCIDVLNRILREGIMGARVIRAFHREDYEHRRFERANSELAEVAVGSGRLTSTMLPLAATIVNLFGIPIVWIATYRIDDGDLQIGVLTAFLGYLSLILVAVMTATFVLMTVPRAEICAERMAEVLDTTPSVRPPVTSVRCLPRPGHLDISGVTFAYTGAQEAVLEDVDLIARPGQTTAVIGSTGSGKSTLLSLATRQADAATGQVRVGGVNVLELSPAVLARSIGFVPQTPFLFAGTVRSNLRYGGSDVSDDQLWQALDVAQAKGFVAELNGGLDAVVTAGGLNLSGGQRQRLAIARALVRPRDIYLFDDSFSALDHGTEARLKAALAQSVGDAAMVIVAQRISAVRNADRIVVLEAGRVVGVGRHEELLVSTPVYQQIAGSQLVEEST